MAAAAASPFLHSMAHTKGTTFTIYTPAANGEFNAETVGLRYVPPTADAHLGAFVWREFSGDGGSTKAPVAAAQGSLPVHLISDVFLGFQSPAFCNASVQARGLDEACCFTLVSRQGTLLDLEGRTAIETQQWLRKLSDLINNSGHDIILAPPPLEPSLDQLQAAASISAQSPPVGVAPPRRLSLGQPPAFSSPASSSARVLDDLRRGSYFYLYTRSSSTVPASPAVHGGSPSTSTGSLGAITKKLILLFYNDSPSRPLFTPEKQLLLGTPDAPPLPADSPLLRCSLFFRYAPTCVGSGPFAGAGPLQPLPTDECVSVFEISDLLVGKQTPLLCDNALASFAPASQCFSLILSRVHAGAASSSASSTPLHGALPPLAASGASSATPSIAAPPAVPVTVELGLECVHPNQMGLWLQGITAISALTSGSDDTSTGVTSAADIGAISTSLPQTPASPVAVGGGERLLSIEHVVSSPGVGRRASHDPAVRALTSGVFVRAWEDDAQQRPCQRAIFLFYVASDNNRTGGSLFWNYLTAEQLAATAAKTAEPPAHGSPLRVQSSHRRLSLDQLQSVYVGPIAALFRRAAATVTASAAAAAVQQPHSSSPHPSCVLSLLSHDDVLHLETASIADRTSLLERLRAVLRVGVAKALVKVDADPTLLATEPDHASSSSAPVEAASINTAAIVAAASIESDRDAAGKCEWYNVQEAAFPSASPLSASPTGLSNGAAAVAASATAAGLLPPISPLSCTRALCECALGTEFLSLSWSGPPSSSSSSSSPPSVSSSSSGAISGSTAAAADSPSAIRPVTVRPICIFFQQTPIDNVIFFVWVERAAGSSGSPDPHRVAQARAWSRSIRDANELAQIAASPSPPYPVLPVSAISDLHIGKNTPIFTQSSAGAALIADECVSIIGGGGAGPTQAPSSTSPSTTSSSPGALPLHPHPPPPLPVELHLVATRGIAQIATLISNVTTLLELDGVRLEQKLWTILRDEGSPAPDANAPHTTAFLPSPSMTSPVPVTSLAPLHDDPRLLPLRAGSFFWRWQFANSLSDAPSVPPSVPRHVIRQKVLLRWSPTDDLGELTWSSSSSNSEMRSASVAGSVIGRMQVTSITDFLIGAEAAPFHPSCVVSSLVDPSATPSALESPAPRAVVDESCFSVIANGSGDAIGDEQLHLESDSGDAHTVKVWLEGLTLLLQSGGRSLTEEPAASMLNAAQPNSTAAPLPLPALSNPATLDELHSVVQVLNAACGTTTVDLAPLRAAYTVAQLHAAVVAIRDAAATRPAESMVDCMASGAARVVVACMRAHPDEHSLQLTGAGALWCLATTAENEALVVAAGGVHVLRENLSRFAGHAGMLQQVCGAIRNVTVIDGHKELFCAGAEGAQASKQLVQALRNHAAVSALAQQAAGCVATLAMFGTNKTVLGDAGAVEAIVLVMSAHKGSDHTAALLHEECCSALRNLAANHAANKDAIAHYGGIVSLVDSMRAHVRSAPNQLHAAGALWNVPANHAANKALVARHGGIEALLAALTHHPDDAEVQLECIGALRNLSTLVDNKALLLAAGVIPAVLLSMRRLLNVALLQEQACALLFNLANYTPAPSSDASSSSSSAALSEPVTSMLLYDAPATLVQVLSIHLLGSPGVVEEAAAALWILRRATSGADHPWPEQFCAQVVQLADKALHAHHASSAVVNLVTGMRAAWAGTTTITPTVVVITPAEGGGAQEVHPAHRALPRPATVDTALLQAHGDTTSIVSPMRTEEGTRGATRHLS